MAEVTGFTADRMLAIEQSTIVYGVVNEEDNLILYTRGGDSINAGHIKGGTAQWISDMNPIILEYGLDIDTLENRAREIAEDLYETTIKGEQLEEDLLQVAGIANNTFDLVGVIQGNLDNAVKSTTVQYALHDTDLEPPESGWSTTYPTKTPEFPFIWMKTTVEKVDGSLSHTGPIPYAATPEKGEQGEQGEQGESAVTVHISSSKGTAFKNNLISTELRATVFYGTEEIKNIYQLRDAFGMSAYLEWYWLRLDDEDFGVISAVDDRLSQAGFVLTISPDDVDEQTTFRCTLHT